LGNNKTETPDRSKGQNREIGKKKFKSGKSEATRLIKKITEKSKKWRGSYVSGPHAI
jgi:hypothetical protein